MLRPRKPQFPKVRWSPNTGGLQGWRAGLQGQRSPRCPDAGRLHVLEGGAGPHSSLRSRTGRGQRTVSVRGPRSPDGRPAVPTGRPQASDPSPLPAPLSLLLPPGPAGKFPASPPQPLPGALCIQFTLRAGPWPPGAAPPPWAQLPGTLWAAAAAGKTCLGRVSAERRRDRDLSGILEQTPFRALRTSTAAMRRRQPTVARPPGDAVNTSFSRSRSGLR